jgi:hypothetical protein
MLPRQVGLPGPNPMQRPPIGPLKGVAMTNKTRTRVHTYYSGVPNLVDDLGLDPFAHRLLVHFVRVCGSDNRATCYESTATTAQRCQMSTGEVSIKRQELARLGLISISSNGHRGYDIRVINLWDLNERYYSLPRKRRPAIVGMTKDEVVAAIQSARSELEPSPDEREPSPDEREPSPDEREPSPDEREPSPDEAKNSPLRNTKQEKLAEEPTASAHPLSGHVDLDGAVDDFVETFMRRLGRNAWSRRAEISAARELIACGVTVEEAIKVAEWLEWEKLKSTPGLGLVLACLDEWRRG